MNREPVTRIPLAIKAVASCLAIILLVLQISLPATRINTTTLILLFLFIVPWWIDSIDSLELPGVAKIQAKPTLSTPSEEERTSKLEQEVIDALVSNEDKADTVEAATLPLEDRATGTRESYQMLETSVLNSLPSLGFKSVQAEVAVNDQDGKKYIADAIALAPSAATIVEITLPMVATIARRKIGYLEKMVRLYSQLRPGVRCRGLLVIGNASEERVKRLFGEVPPPRIDIALYDQASSCFTFPYGRK